MTAPVLMPLQFEPPLQNPSPYGLFAATDWQVPADTGDSSEGDAVRHLLGVEFRPVGNYAGQGQFGLWETAWCGGMIQVITVTATGGNWVYTYAGQATVAVPRNVTAGALLTAIVNLSNVAPGDVTVVSPTAGTYIVNHRIRGAVGVASDVGTPLTGGTVSIEPARKEGLRQAGLPPFDPFVPWAYDECDLMDRSRREVRTRAAQILRLEEQVAVEGGLAARMLVDAGAISTTVATLAEAVGYLEGQLAITSTLGHIHIGAQWVARNLDVFLKSGTTYRSPLGHLWVIGGGYVDGLDNAIVATSPIYGWRDEPTVRDAIDERHNTFAAVAERTVLVGYEHVIAAVEIDTTP